MRVSRDAVDYALVPFTPSFACEATPPPLSPGTKPRILDRVRDEIRRRNYSRRTEKSYIGWMKRFYLFHGKRNPLEMGEAEISTFLTHLAVREKVSASTQNQALSALLFLYRDVLRRDIAWMDGVVRAKRPVRLPVVLSRQEVRALLGCLDGTEWLMASLLYGAGLRLLECCRLRVKDVDFIRKEITVRDGKGLKDRVTLLPATVITPLAAHVERARLQHGEDLRGGKGSVELPHALERKYPRAPWEWGWAVGLSSGPLLQRPCERAMAAASPARIRSAEGGPSGCPPSRHRQTGDMPHPAAFVRHASSRERIRHPNHTGTAGAQRCQHDDDLHPCPE